LGFFVPDKKDGKLCGWICSSFYLSINGVQSLGDIISQSPGIRPRRSAPLGQNNTTTKPNKKLKKKKKKQK